jgi:endonuclease V-like protein UPF0215 family
VARRISNTIGIDDAPFERAHRGDVAIIGAVFARTRLDGMVTSSVRRDGRNATTQVAAMIERSPFDQHIQAVLLQGIALAGFNVVDIHALHEQLERPVLVIARRQPDMPAIRRALLERVPGGRRKLALIENAGPMERIGGVWAQRAGLSLAQARQCVSDLAVHSRIPEPLRVAHILAGALTEGTSHGRA